MTKTGAIKHYTIQMLWIVGVYNNWIFHTEQGLPSSNFTKPPLSGGELLATLYTSNLTDSVNEL